MYRSPSSPSLEEGGPPMHADSAQITHKVLEKIIEVPRTIIREKFVEVPEVQYVEKIVEVPEVIMQETVKHVPVIHTQERVVKVPRVHMIEKIVEVPHIEYREVMVEKIVEVPEVQEEFVIKNVEVPQYVEVPVPQYKEVIVDHPIERNIPRAVEISANYEYKIPRIRPKYNEIRVPVYVARFIEVPVPAQMLDEGSLLEAQQLVTKLQEQAAASL
eukprot:GHVU01011221.1.p1 GENE.GHVU01011221.1~~GHVU01011221.1.p1  ORF type:complete len:216 (+),score=37.73 GHVU01011221.1:256-903(+)